MVDSLLLYVTGGLAWADFNRNHTYFFEGIPGVVGPFSQTFNSSKTRLGFAVGAGTEWALNANWSVVSEILYMGFEKDNRSYACASASHVGSLMVSAQDRFATSSRTTSGSPASA